MARVATRLGLQAKSFDLAAAGFSDAVGREISGDSMARLTEDWGRRVAEQRRAEADRANRPSPRGERLTQRRLPEVAPISTQANISTDGAMLLVRTEGWKEVKVVAISEVRVQAAWARSPAQPSRRDADPRLTLARHSYQAGLWDADTMALYQYAEGLRRGLDYCPKRSSVNDGALWIKRITDLNFPGVPQIVDWSHAAAHLWAVANAVHGEGTAAAQQWVEPQLDRLWCGQVAQVVDTLDQLDLQQPRWPDLVREAPDYFRANQERMRYADFRAQSYPIGSGTVESAANTVIHHRLRRPGRGWTRDNAQAMLAGLSELHSGRFEHAWYHLALN
ncbi:MAG TPA: hypothetical protein PKW05_13710 [Anaerolineae bacterium]|nr:hypothetical protein [Anaerolineae bacterium]